jgi:hypothetical protein
VTAPPRVLYSRRQRSRGCGSTISDDADDDRASADAQARAIVARDGVQPERLDYTCGSARSDRHTAASARDAGHAPPRHLPACSLQRHRRLPGSGVALGAVFKKTPLVSVPYKVFKSVKSGVDASRSFTAEDSHGFEPSGLQQFGAGAVNATSMFIDQSMYGLPYWILNNTRPK